jgi:type VI secretion system secreted protein VgrG
MAAFAPAVAVLLQHEGGFVDSPTDPGGATNWGISAVIRHRFQLTPEELGLRDFSVEEIRMMTPGAAVAVYERHFWDRYGLGAIVDQSIATKLLMQLVNFNPPSMAVVFAQRACGDAGHPTTVDGALGPLTLAALNAVDPPAWQRAFAGHCLRFYEKIVELHPERGEWLPVWRKRCVWGVPAKPEPVIILPP